MRPSIRNSVSLDSHTRFQIEDVAKAGLPVTNVIVVADGDAEKTWMEAVTSKIGDWRAFARSVYIRWAITINAMHVAEARYRNQPLALTVHALRMENGALGPKVLKAWAGPEAADAYIQALSLVPSYALVDLYGTLEEIVFDFYEIYLRHHPQPLLRGDEFGELRRFYARRNSSAEAEAAWRAAWEVRFKKWRRKRAYDSLHVVFKALFLEAGLERPRHFKDTDLSDWCRTIEMIAELRHLITHGEAMASRKLSELSTAKERATFDFKEGEEIRVLLHHVQSVELFADQLLTTINISICEKAWGEAWKPPADLV